MDTVFFSFICTCMHIFRICVHNNNSFCGSSNSNRPLIFRPFHPTHIFDVQLD